MSSLTEQDITELLDWVRGRMFDLRTAATKASNNGSNYKAMCYDAQEAAFKEVHEHIVKAICKRALAQPIAQEQASDGEAT